MQVEKLSYHWLFERHPKPTIRAWLGQLRYFYYKRAWGGHANDGDEFQVAILFTDRQDLMYRMGQVGLTLPITPNDFPKPAPAESPPTNEYNEIKTRIKKFPDLEQPGHCIIFGHKVFLWVHDQAIHITVSGTRDGNHYEVSEDDLKICVALEKYFDHLAWQKIIDKSLEDSVCCISQTKYPELYGEEGEGTR